MDIKVSTVKPPVHIHTCKNCKVTFTGKICNQCGEKVFDEKQLTAGHFFKQVADLFWHWESKVIKTIKLNFIKPGFVTAENIRGVRVPYAKPFQLFLVVSLLFFLVVSKLRVTDYIPSSSDYYYYSLSDYSLFKWAAPLDRKVVSTLDSMWVKKGREIESVLLADLKTQADSTGSLYIKARKNLDSMRIDPGRQSLIAFDQMKIVRQTMFANSVKTFGKTLIFILIPFIAGLFYLIFYKRIKYYGAALIFATHFIVFNLCFYSLYCILNTGPSYIHQDLGGWISKPFKLIFFNSYTTNISSYLFGSPFEFMHLLFWIPWLFLACKRLFGISWWKNIIISYFLSRIFYFLIYGILKKIVIAVTIWSMH